MSGHSPYNMFVEKESPLTGAFFIVVLVYCLDIRDTFY